MAKGGARCDERLVFGGHDNPCVCDVYSHGVSRDLEEDGRL